jgi:glycosyltransferase involved in cell wall biosynthesis
VNVHAIVELNHLGASLIDKGASLLYAVIADQLTCRIKMLAAETPQISVVMPVHNALPHLDAAVESILGQTFRNFEFVILDDASTDGSTQRLREWAARDQRIRLIEEKRNLGPALSSERAARAATAPIVARMDADDISYPTRIAEQLQVLNEDPSVGVVGGLYDIIDASGQRIRPAEPWRLLQSGSIPPFGNGPMMYRRQVFERAGGYRKACEFWEDQDLILRMAAISKVMVLPYAIYQARQSRTSTRFASEEARVERALDLMYRSRARLEQHESYEDLLYSPQGHRKIHPWAFVSLGSVILWAGEKPRLFRRLLRDGELRVNLCTFWALGWTAWASLEPYTLRRFLRLWHVAQSARASLIVRTDRPFLWRALVPRTDASSAVVPAE